MSPYSPLVPAVLLALILGCAQAAGCGGDGVRPCSVSADCASGVCLPDGRCAAVTADASSGDDALDASAGDAVSDVTTREDATGPASDAVGDAALADGGADGASTVCAPNHDGEVTRAEIPIAPGLRATYAIATGVAHDTRAAVGEGGDKAWDLAGELPGDQRSLVETLDPSAWWFGASFEGATYATRLGASEELLGVFRVSDDGLELLGVVSPSDGALRTELRYDPPALLLAFPLALDAAWTTTSAVSGVTNGVPTLATETYEARVDAAGTVVTPFASFDALRVVVALDRWVGAALYFDVQHLFVAECFGTVASIRSEGYVSATEFTTAAELRRLAP